MKAFSRICGCILAVFLLAAGCGGRREDAADLQKAGQPGKKIKVAATLFPYYDFVRQIAGEKVELSMVVPAGMDSHSFEPTPADMRTIQEADVLICNGGAMEHWVNEVLGAIDTSELRVVTMMEYVDVVEEEIAEGMEKEAHDHGHYGEREYDEHIWTSPINAKKFVKIITEVLCEADPQNQKSYETGREAYEKELDKLHQGFLEVVKNERRNMIIVGDKFPFRYLAEEYGFDYRAAFSGCSTDTEPSAKTIAYLIDKVRQEKIPVVYYLELSSHRVSEIIGEETEAVPLLLHSCHNVTRREFDRGVTYVDLMKGNIESLRKGLDE